LKRKIFLNSLLFCKIYVIPAFNPLTNQRGLFVCESTENIRRGWSYNCQKKFVYTWWLL